MDETCFDSIGPKRRSGRIQPAGTENTRINLYNLAYRMLGDGGSGRRCNPDHFYFCLPEIYLLFGVGRLNLGCSEWSSNNCPR